MAPIQDPPMPKYQCHKVVSALKIFDVVQAPDGGYTLYPHDPRYAPIQVTKDWYETRIGKVTDPGDQTRGYFVQYENQFTSWSPIRAFEDGYVLEDDADASIIHGAARAAHESNRILCQALGDNSQVPWEQAPDWQKSSAVIGVTAIKSNPSTTSEQSHACWLAVKEADGWKYGPVKDATLKVHPCMVAYSALSANQRLKDELFGVVVRAVLGL